jgi:hypothetical protein
MHCSPSNYAILLLPHKQLLCQPMVGELCSMLTIAAAAAA